MTPPMTDWCRCRAAVTRDVTFCPPDGHVTGWKRGFGGRATGGAREDEGITIHVMLFCYVTCPLFMIGICLIALNNSLNLNVDFQFRHCIAKTEGLLSFENRASLCKG